MKTNNLTIFSVLLAIVIEVMSMGLFMPLLPDLFWSAHSPLLAANTPEFWRQMDYGLSFAFWAIGIFFGAPFLGELSDRFGRKKILVTSLLMVAISYFCSELSLVAGSTILFMASRVLSGFFASAFPIAQAIIVDISPENKRARNLGWITLAASIGIVFGPFLSGISYQLGGIASGPRIAFGLAAGLTLLNALSIFILFKETMLVSSKRAIHFFSVFSSCKFAFFDRRIRYLTLIFLTLMTLWAFYFQGVVILLSSEFKQGPVAVSYFYMALGAGFFVMALWIQPWIFKKYTLRSLGMGGMLLLALAFGAGLIFQKVPVFWLGGILGCMAQSLCYTALMTLFSGVVNQDEQGRVMGGVGATFGLTWGIISPLSGILLGVSHFLPLILSAGLAVVGFFLMMRISRVKA